MGTSDSCQPPLAPRRSSSSLRLHSSFKQTSYLPALLLCAWLLVPGARAGCPLSLVPWQNFGDDPCSCAWGSGNLAWLLTGGPSVGAAVTIQGWWEPRSWITAGNFPACLGRSGTCVCGAFYCTDASGNNIYVGINSGPDGYVSGTMALTSLTRALPDPLPTSSASRAGRATRRTTSTAGA